MGLKLDIMTIGGYKKLESTEKLVQIGKKCLNYVLDKSNKN